MMNTNTTPEKQLTGYPSIDKPWLKYYSEEAINAPLPECTVYENVYQHNKAFANQTALEYFGAKISYERLFEQIDSCASALAANGITQGSIVNICSSATPEIAYLVLACSKIGAVANFVNPLFDTQQKIDRINDTASDTLFVMDKMYQYREEQNTSQNAKGNEN